MNVFLHLCISVHVHTRYEFFVLGPLCTTPVVSCNMGQVTKFVSKLWLLTVNSKLCTKFDKSFKVLGARTR